MSAGPHMRLERDCPAPVCGVDEVGRGPWAGPVYAAAVILPARRAPKGIDDSKKLAPARREVLEIAIKEQAVAWGVGFASAEEMDVLNITGATGLAMRRAIAAMGTEPAFALVDGNYAFHLPCPVRPVIGGDGLSLSIAAASILAKVARDRVMVEMDALHPGYGFAAHKGYGVRRHAEALAVLGPCPIHRRSWTPVRLAIEGSVTVLAAEAGAED